MSGSKKIALTETQKGIYFDCQLDDPIAYHLSATFLLHDLNEQQLKNAFKLLIAEQEVLRSSLEILNDFPVLVIPEHFEFELATQDLSNNQLNQEECIKQIVEDQINCVFDLTKAPLFRCTLLKVDHQKHLFVICIHHLISDGTSLNTLMKKLLSIYSKLQREEVIVLKNDDGFYNFIEKENNNLLLNKYSKEKEFWTQKMQGIEPLNLQTDYSIKQKKGIGKEKRFTIPTELAEAIQQLSMNQEVTVYMFYLAAFSVLISTNVQSEEVVLNSPFSYRPDLELEATIGCFIRMLPLRFNIKQDEAFSHILQHVSKELINAFKNIKYPSNLIFRDSLSSLPMASASSIFDVIYVYDVYEDIGQEAIEVELVDQDVVTFPGSLMVVLNKMPNQYLIKIQYKSDLFSDETIELMGCRYLSLLESLIANVNIKVQDLCLFLDKEKDQLLYENNKSTFINYRPQTLIDIFSSKVLKHPNRIALIEGDKQITYAQVNAQVEQLACRILKHKTKVNEHIGIQLDRSMNVIISILAVLKAGCAYVAIEPTYPNARKEFIFKDAEISLLITTSNLPCDYTHTLQYLLLDEVKTHFDVSDFLQDNSNPFSLAYIAYTSGSTGNPKGVMIENHSVVNVLSDLDRRFPVQNEDVFLYKTPYLFDLSVSELFGWFVGEGSLFILEPGGETNPQLVLDMIDKHHITHMNFVPSMFRLFLELFDDEYNLAKIKSLKWIFIGGEKVTTDIFEKFSALNTNIRLECMYGPTECTLWATTYATHNFSKRANIPIGTPLNEIRCYVLGKQDQLQPIGIPGELCLSGVGLARGYINLEAMTQEKFVSNPFFREGVDAEYYRRMYRTGDLVRWLPCGNLDFLGRIDFQVKMRGLRLELEEIEKALAKHDGIIQAIVVVKKELNKADLLCAYYLSEFEIPEAKIKDYLASLLPIYMVPSFFIHKNEFPQTSGGKVDRKVLTADISYRANLKSKQILPKTDLEQKLAAIWKEVLSIDEVGLDDNFFEVGGHSLSLIQLNIKLKKSLNQDIPINLHFQLPTVRLLAEYFSNNKVDSVVDRNTLFKRSEKTVYQDIAIIGMSVNVPGAQKIHDFWNNLVHEKESIHFYEDEELKQLGISSETINDPHYVKARGRVEGIEYFDPAFFDYTPAEIQMMSPQLRLLYQGMWEAFEDAGYFPNSDSSTIGLFLGGSDEFEWYRKTLFGSGSFVDKYQAFTLSSNHFLATRLAYKLDIKGPAFTALTACSTTLATTHLACQSLILGECDLAVAGGITVELPNDGGYLYQSGMMFSPDGHCRPFDAKAEGTIFSNGFGLAVLKRLDAAIKDGDPIYAVIKGSAMNNDGDQKLGYTAPSVKGQTQAIQSAYRVAGIDPETVSYIEAHGTGTLLGDPVEVESLTQAFASTQKQFCTLGSVKGNIGHTDTAAGIVSLLKVALSIKHKYIPGTVNYEEPNPKIDFSNTPFSVTSKGAKWEKSENRALLRAGINAFGVGGTNVHMVLEEAPKLPMSDAPADFNLLVFSAKSPRALLETTKEVLGFLHNNPEINLSDVAWTLQVGRKAFEYRKMLVVKGVLNLNNKEVQDFLNNPGQKISSIKNADLIELKQKCSELLSTKSHIDPLTFNNQVGDLWCSGLEIDWRILKGDTVRTRVSLPNYVFDKIYFPIDINVESHAASSMVAVVTESLERLEFIVIEAYKTVLGFSSIESDQDFFALGGDSLKAASLAATVSSQLSAKIDIAVIFQNPSPKTLADYLSTLSADKESYPAITASALKEFYPLSSAQSRMYTLYLLGKNSLAYNLPSATLVKGELNKQRLELTVKKLVARHEALRTVFTTSERQLVQVILPDYTIPITYSESLASSQDEITELVYRFIQPFDFEQGPPFRVELVKVDSNASLLLFDIHHIIADGTSMEIITRDFNQLYFGVLSPQNIHYKDFAIWQNDFLESEALKVQERFWMNALAGELPVLEFPTDFKRPAIKSFDGDRVYFNLEETLTGQLIHCSQETGTTLFMLFLAMWNVFISRYSNQEDVIIGVPVSGRTQKEIEDTVGMFVNMLPMRNFSEAGKKFIDFLAEVKENALNAFNNQDYPFDKLVKQLNLKREMNRNPLFEICFNFENMKFHELEIEDISFIPYSFGTRNAVYDLTLTLSENKSQGTIGGYIEYATGLFRRETIEHMVANFQKMLSSIVTQKEIVIEQIDIVSSSEKQLLCGSFNNNLRIPVVASHYSGSRIRTELTVDRRCEPKAKQSSDLTRPLDCFAVLATKRPLHIHNMFEQNARDFPDKTALVLASGASLTYAQLNEKANALAWHLIELGLKKEAIVGVMTNRDEYLLVSLLGVLKAGGAYLPLDPEYPVERISYMLSHSKVGFLICPRHYRNKVDFNGYILSADGYTPLPNNPALDWDHLDGSPLSYVLYTSGTTGKPKGVMIEHASIINLIYEVQSKGYFPNQEDRMLCLTTMSFDIFAFEALIPLFTGNSVYLADETEYLDPALVGKKIIEHKITHLFSTVSRLKAFVESTAFHPALKQLKCIFSGGEHFPLPLLSYLQNHTQAKIYNMYGPTEVSIWSTLKELTYADEINVGQPIANTQVYILNPAGKLQPIGVFGELCLSGYGLARGYLNDPDETNAKFVRLPDITPQRVYKTGDRARYLPSGELEVSGRLDSQVKVRGYRIELNEIEEVALQHDQVQQAVAITFEDKKQDRQLALFYCAAQNHSLNDSAWLKNWLEERVPHYMVPSSYIPLDKMPLLPNGKINRKALSLPAEQACTVKAPNPSLGNLENTLLSFWKEQLNLENISVKDNFFDLGGNSLGLIHINNRLNTWLGRSVSLIQLFEYPTIESLVKSLGVHAQQEDAVIAPTKEDIQSTDIAIIGISCKLPGADTTDEFWSNLVSGAETITQFEDEELIKSGIEKSLLANPNYKKVKGFLKNAEYFDSAFFNYTENEANIMDPQIRIVHQCAWEALEDAGYNSFGFDGTIGLFAGSSSNLLWVKQWIKEDEDLLHAFEAITFNEKDFLTTRLSYKLNLKGPSFNIQTACSTSLVAIHQAAQSIINGESDMAIAGGVSISYPRKEGYLWHEGMIFSKDGHCRPFSDGASGIIPGNGCGLVVLKRLSDALRDNDSIYAVIKGTAINNDGIEKVGYTAPSINGQRTVIEAAVKKSGVLPEEISYLEAHGTATKIGDPIEFQALKTAWKSDKKNYCAIGSVKANVGHLDAAAGVASFIKTALILKHKIIPPLPNFKSPNPLIDLQDSPFYINTEAKQIEESMVMRAGVSSFGIGGTNVHMILEQAPFVAQSKPADAVNLLVFSARSPEALLNTSVQVMSYLQNNPALNLSDVAWTLQVGRKAFEYRKVLVVEDGLHLKPQDVQDFLNCPGHKIPEIRTADLTELEQRFATLLSSKNQIDSLTFNKKVGELWCEGLSIDWSALHATVNRRRISLPTYVFDKKYYPNDVVPHLRPAAPSVQTQVNADIHQQLAQIWTQIFGCDSIHKDDDFFALGGDSLKAVFLAAQIQKFMEIQISLADIFAHSVFKHMVAWLMSHKDHLAFYKIAPLQKQPHYEVSSAQKRQYILHEMLGSSVPYNLGAVYSVEGVLKRDKFEEIINTLIERHEAFRTTFTMVNDEVVQMVEEVVDPIIEFECCSETEVETKVAEFIRPFDLSKAPLIRVKLITLNDIKHILLIDIHHIIADQSSIAVLVREFTDLYLGKVLPPLILQYKDFAAWQNSLLNKPEIQNQIDYWSNEFKDEIPYLSLPADFPRPTVQTFEGERLVFKLDSNLNYALESFLKKHGLTPFMLFIAVFKLVLWKYSGQNDLVVGTGIAGRRHADLKSIVGMFVNTLAIRTQVNDKLTIEEYLQYIKQKMIKAYDNQECQFEQLIDLLNIEKDISRNPLFDVAINYLDLENSELILEELSLKPWPDTKVYSKFDMVWNIEKRGADYFSEIEFNTSLYKVETIEALSNKLVHTLTLILSEPEFKLHKFCLLSAPEKHRIIYELNQTTTLYPKDKTLVQLFAEQVQLRGDNTAIICNDETLSYAELNIEADKIANLLRAHHVEPGQFVAIMLERCPLQIVCILGILKLGCAYVPIDPDNPIERTHFILENSGAKALLTHSQFTISTKIEVLFLDAIDIQAQIASFQPVPITPEDTAYAIYTSGSTGTPKGIFTSHQNVIRLVKQTNYIEVKPEDRILRLFNYAFDGSVFDIFGALLNGACLVIASKEATIEMSYLAEIIKQQGISVLFTTTAQFNLLVDWDVTSLMNVRKILFGGELASILHSRKALRFLGQDRLVHAYGPTEATVMATYYPINHIDENLVSIPIGYPVSNCKVYILDKQGQPVSDNVSGELYIGGDAVAKGYLNQQDLTSQKFIKDPFVPEGRMYRTGDMVRRLSTDEIVFIGREDFQVKIRGYRIELTEIEFQLKSIPGIKDIVVTSKEDHNGAKYIAAYYTVNADAIHEDQIRSILSEKMPGYMIPSHISMLKSLPLNANGKVDLKALPGIEQTQNNICEPKNTTEEFILLEVKKLLNRDIGVKDDFFKCGGHSLKAVALVNALAKLGIKVLVSEVFQHRTVENLANLPQFEALRKNQEQEFAVLPTVSLNDTQIKGLTDHIAATCSCLSKLIYSASEVSRFPLSSLQMVHLMQGSMLSGFTTEIDGDIQEASIRKQLAKIIMHNQLLHCVIQNDLIPVWKENDVSELGLLIERSIPYLDLREFEHQTKESILNQLSVFILTSAYQEGSLLWRICCLRLNQHKHLVIWGFDHISFDGMSAEVIRNQIINGNQQPQKYQEYVMQLKKGPVHITEAEIIDEFSLVKWEAKNRFIMQKLADTLNKTKTTPLTCHPERSAVSSTQLCKLSPALLPDVPRLDRGIQGSLLNTGPRGQAAGRRQISVKEKEHSEGSQVIPQTKKEITFDIPLIGNSSEAPWKLAFQTVIKILRAYFDTLEIPLGIVHYGRSYQQQNYYNCLGEFLDVIPVLVKNSDEETEVIPFLEKTRLHAINFISLLVDHDLSKTYTRIAQILAPAFKTNGEPQQLVLFNFLGYLPKNEKNILEKALTGVEKKHLSEVSVIAHYDEDKVTISIDGLDGYRVSEIIRSIGEITYV